MHVRRTLAALGTATALLVGGAAAGFATAAPAAADDCVIGYAVKITASAVNLRKGPATSYGSKGQLFKGEVVQYVTANTNLTWSKVKLFKKSKSGLAKGTTGWVKSSYTKDWGCVPTS